MAKQRLCSECSTDITSLAYAAKTCSPACRQKRARRLARQKRDAGRARAYPPELSAVADAKDLAAEVMKEELRPIVREALTTDVLHGLDRLVKLTPRAIEKLEEDLESADETIRQRAYTLLLRYTLGNPSVAPPPADQQPSGMTVVFNVPRAEDAPQDVTLESSDPEELRECSECHTLKGTSEFVGASLRCQACHDELQERIKGRFGG